ncbi:MAG: tRNA 4-thiouridine(8) synthase ThiI [Kiritimatiellae bacterium]|nr:tRNA 4-thiouridine(8) synthase ThiI [Kiritimatiellia bacterium]
MTNNCETQACACHDSRHDEMATKGQGRAGLAARGLSLLSGGLDSMLAVCVMRAQGCHVEAIVFDSPFFKIDAARAAAAALDVRLHVVDFTTDIVGLLRHPPHGFGGALNPCIDCHALMIRRAGEMVVSMGWDFVATGEVLNQRPMSQNRRSLDLVARASGMADLLIRPLSALRLDPTRPELDGRVTRARLLDLEGRSRRSQMDLAAQYGIREYPSPAGGCLLTEKLFCAKLRDLMTRDGLDHLRDVSWLRLGRHFRLPGGAKCVVGRDAGENVRLQAESTPDDLVLRPVGVPGPTVVLPAAASTSDRLTAAAICAGYCDNPGSCVRIRLLHGTERHDEDIVPLARASAHQWMPR